MLLEVPFVKGQRVFVFFFPLLVLLVLLVVVAFFLFVLFVLFVLFLFFLAVFFGRVVLFLVVLFFLLLLLLLLFLLLLFLFLLFVVGPTFVFPFANVLHINVGDFFFLFTTANFQFPLPGFTRVFLQHHRGNGLRPFVFVIVHPDQVPRFWNVHFSLVLFLFLALFVLFGLLVLFGLGGALLVVPGLCFAG